MRLKPLSAVVFAIALGLPGARCGAGEDKAAPPPPPAQPAARETAKVAKESLRIEAVLTGMLEARNQAEVVLDPEAWTAFIVKRACEQGARVKKGDLLVEFETEKIDEEIRDTKAALEISKLGVDGAADDLRWLQETAPLDLAAAVRARQIAEEDLKRYLEADGPLAERTSQNAVKLARFALEYTSEELRQLEKMYKADDITEDTEEIILTRARRDVESAKFSLEATVIRTEEHLKLNLPRQKEALQEGLKRAALAMEKATAALPKLEAKKKLDLQKLKTDHEKARRHLEDLEKDRSGMTIASPREGIVYFGRFQRGKWADPAALHEELKPGGKIVVLGKRILMTVFEPRPLVIRCDVSEKDTWLVLPGAEGRAQPTSFPWLRLKAKVDHVSAMPHAPGLFDGRIQVDLGDDAAMLLPGMECQVRILGYQNLEARMIPQGALFFDETAGDHPCVYLAKPEGASEKRHVAPGKRADGKVEILDGLQEGDEIFLKKPEKEPKGF